MVSFLRLRPQSCCRGGFRLMLRGCTRAIISAYERSLGQPNAFWVENVSLREKSTELTGEGGETMP